MGPAMPKRIVLGQFTPEAENVARDADCAVTPVASLVARGPGSEDYVVGCQGGRTLAVRCEFGNCRVMP
jgi:hypothetical protein